MNPYLARSKIFFGFGLYVDIFSGLTLINFENILAIFVKESYKKRAKKLVFTVFHSINSYFFSVVCM